MQQNIKSIWVETAQRPSFSTLHSNIQTDVAIVGAGITGMTLAYLLAKKGVKVTVLESDRVGSGVTSFSTGHLTSSIDADYSFISSRIDKQTAFQVARSMQAAIDLVGRIAQEENIDCDYVRLSAYQYTEDAMKVKELEDELHASQEAGLVAMLTDGVPLPFPVKKAFEIKNQADFHPLKFIQGLAQCVLRDGGEIYEKAHVIDVADKDVCTITTKDSFTVQAKQVVLATHTPIQFNVTQTELIPYRSYSIAAKVADRIPKGLYWDTLEFYHYIRTYEVNGESYLIVGGEDHKVGKANFDENEAFTRLEAYTREKFNVLSITHRWSAELFYSVDGLPFIGKSPFGKNKFIATGFTGDGLTFSVVSATLLADLLTGHQNPLEKIYNPARVHPIAAATDFVEQNLDFALHFIKDRFITGTDQSLDIPRGEGRLIKIEGKQLAVYCDENNTLHALSPKCTHMGCIVQWNDSEKSWDCPCHGGRFSATGEVLNGPAVTALQRHIIEIKPQK